jgi:predicted dehydrogenase
LTEPLERSGQKQAAWRTDPARSGAGGAIGDIGTHAHQLAAYVTGLELDEVCAELSRFIEGRALDDNAQVMLRYRNGARGLLWASQVAPGNENNLRLRVYGSKGGIDWHQEQPNQLQWSPFGQPTQIISRGAAAANAAAARVSRIPSGHPEGYLEGFATLYAEIAQAIRSARPGGPNADKAAHFPTLLEGLRGVEFIEAVVKSSARGGRWVQLPR